MLVMSNIIFIAICEDISVIMEIIGYAATVQFQTYKQRFFFVISFCKYNMKNKQYTINAKSKTNHPMRSQRQRGVKRIKINLGMHRFLYIIFLFLRIIHYRDYGQMITVYLWTDISVPCSFYLF